MHKTSRLLIEIIKLALWDKSIDESQLSSLDYKEWQGLYQCACVQGGAAIFFDGVDKLQKKSKTCKRLLSSEGVQAVIGSETRWLGQMEVALGLSAEFEKHGLKMLLLKGGGVLKEGGPYSDKRLLDRQPQRLPVDCQQKQPRHRQIFEKYSERR